jgi:two-component system sensor histidine kinase UhpB
MAGNRDSLAKIQKRLMQVPIVYRLLIGNSAIVFISVLLGTLLTRQLTQVNTWVLILVFSVIGLLSVFLFNYATIRISLSSLEELQRTIDAVGFERVAIPKSIVIITDPDIQSLTDSINAMLSRLESHNQELRALSERATNAQEEERRRIARNLHDETSQSLSSLIIRLERIEGNLPPDSSELRNQLKQAREIATGTLEGLRKIIYDLRPTMLDDLGLVPAVRWYARSTLEAAGVRVQFEIPDEVLRLPAHLETELFRIAQEGLNNIANHSNARRVIVRLTQDAEHACLELDDDGSGFDVEATATSALPSKRLGLLGIQERVSLVGGDVDILSSPGQGTMLRVCVPYHLEKQERLKSK